MLTNVSVVPRAALSNGSAVICTRQSLSSGGVIYYTANNRVYCVYHVWLIHFASVELSHTTKVTGTQGTRVHLANCKLPHSVIQKSDRYTHTRVDL